MSRTNAKTRKEKNPLAFFPTPPALVHALLGEEPLLLPQEGQAWIEPCAGDGDIISAVNEWTLTYRGVAHRPRWTAVEIDIRRLRKLAEVGAHHTIIDDARTYYPKACTAPYDKHFSVCITNPPFHLAGEIWGAMRHIADVLVMLLRVGFLEAAARYPWLSRDMPHVRILSPRPSFSLDGNNDSATYAWMLWDQTKRKKAEVSILGWRPDLVIANQLSIFESLPLSGEAQIQEEEEDGSRSQ